MGPWITRGVGSSVGRGRRRAASPRRLTVESLEDRQMLSIANNPPTDITLSNNTVQETVDPTAIITIGNFTTTDIDPGDSHTYSLVAGSGSTDNAYFAIQGNALKNSKSLDYETKSSYSIRVRTTDAALATYEKIFAITVTDLNDPPSRTYPTNTAPFPTVSPITLTVIEDALPTPVGFANLAYSAGDVGQTLTYRVTALPTSIGQIVRGDTMQPLAIGDTPTIDVLRAVKFAPTLNANGTGSFVFSITDSGTPPLSITQNLDITVTAVDDPPTDITLTPGSVSENLPTGTAVGTLSTVDVDTPDNSHVYSLVAGSGSTDNGLFQIDGKILRTSTVLDYETKPSCWVRIRSMDLGGVYFEKSFNVTIVNVNDPPVRTAGTVADLTVDEDAAATSLGLSLVDYSPVEAGQTLTYTVTAIPAAADGQILLTDGTPVVAATDYSLTQVRGLRFQPAVNANTKGRSPLVFTYVVNDHSGGTETLSQTINISVTPVNDTPVRTAGTLTPIVWDEDSARGSLGLGLINYGPGGGADENNQTLTYQVSSVPSTLGTVYLSDGTTVVTAGQVTSLAELRGMLLLPTPNAVGTSAFTFTVKDDGTWLDKADAKTLVQTVGIQFLEINDPPVLTQGSAGPLSMPEDSGLQPLGLSGIAYGPGGGADEAEQRLRLYIDAVPSPSLGTIYMADGLTPVAPGEYSVPMLRAMLFLPTSDAAGTGHLVYHLVDNGTTRGVSAPARLDQDVSITITPINDPPVRTAGNLDERVIIEDAPLVSLGLDNLDYNPGGGADEAAQTLTYRVVSVPDPLLAHVYLADGSTLVAPGVYTLPQIRGMTFLSLPNAAGSTSLVLSVTDNGFTGSTLTPQTLTEVLPIHISEVNDVPVRIAGNVNPVVGAEDTWIPLQLDGVQYSPGGGADEAAQTLSVLITAAPSPEVGSVYLADGVTPVTLGSLYTVWQLQGMKYLSAPNRPAPSLTFSFQIIDNGTTAGVADPKALDQSMTITVNEVNDLPVRTAGAVTDLHVPEDSGILSMGFAGLTYSPGGGADEAGQTLTYTVTAVPTAGLGAVYLADGTTVVRPGTYTIEQIRGMEFHLLPDVYAGTTYFRFTIADNGTTSGVADPKSINEVVALYVFAVNDPPVRTSGTIPEWSGIEGSGTATLGLGGLSYGVGGGLDEAGQALSYTVVGVPDPAFGAVVLGDGATVVQPGAYTISQIRAMMFRPAPDGAGTASFVFRVSDNGMTNGLPDSKWITETVPITLIGINDPPVLTAGNLDPRVFVEDTPGSLGFENLAYAGGPAPDEPSQPLTYTINAVPAGLGQVVLADGTPVAPAGVYTIEQLRGLRWVPAANANGSATLTWTVQDQGTTLGQPDPQSIVQSLQIDVTPVNDPPVRTAGSTADVTVPEDSPLVTLGLSALSYSPGGGPDEAAQQLTCQVTAVPAASLGQVFLADGTTVVAPGPYSLDALRGMLFLPAPNAFGTGSLSFEIQDNGVPVGTLAENLAIVVTSVPDAPSSLTLSGSTIDENQPAGTAIGTFSATDPDPGDTFTYQLVAGPGDTGNAKFAIDAAGRLTSTAVFDYETQTSYSIRVGVTDSAGLTRQEVFTIQIGDLPDGTTEVELPGVYAPATSTFMLRDSQSGGDATWAFDYGVGGVGWVPLSGDWDGNGQATPGLYDPATSTFYLRNALAGGDADLMFTFGVGGLGWVPLVGDWDGNNTDTVGLYDPASSTFFLRNAHLGGDADVMFSFGVGGLGWKPLAGNWDGVGGDTVGLYVPASSTFFLRNVHDGGAADETFDFGVGGLGWQPLAGKWNSHTRDGVGLYVPETSTFFLKHQFSPGAADVMFSYGVGGLGWQPLVGDWRPAAPPGAAPAAAPSAPAIDQLDLAALAAAQLQPSPLDSTLDLLTSGIGKRRK